MILCLVVTDDIHWFFTTAGDGSCSDSLTNSAMRELGDEVDRVKESNYTNLYLDIALICWSFVPLSLWVYKKYFKKKEVEKPLQPQTQQQPQSPQQYQPQQQQPQSPQHQYPPQQPVQYQPQQPIQYQPQQPVQYQQPQYNQAPPQQFQPGQPGQPGQPNIMYQQPQVPVAPGQQPIYVVQQPHQVQQPPPQQNNDGMSQFYYNAK